LTEYRLTATTVPPLGRLRVRQSAGPAAAIVSAPDQIEIIMDASGSMRAKAGGEVKIAAAKHVLKQLIEKLPSTSQVALRVYGHRLPSEPKAKSCQDTQLVVPFKPLDRTALTAAIDSITPKGQTPIGLSLSQLSADFGSVPGKKSVIVVTDGIETCDPTPGYPNFPPKVVDRLVAAGVEIKVDIVGFDIGSDSQTRKFLSELASKGGGKYYDAANGAQLAAALSQVIRSEYVVSDRAGNTIGKGMVGDPPVTLPIGTYRLSLTSQPPIDLGAADVKSDQETLVELYSDGNSRVSASVEFAPP